MNEFRGLNTKVKTKFLPGFIRDGKNFIITDEGYIEKIWGSRKIYKNDEHGLLNITFLFAHKQISELIFAGGSGKLMKFDGGSWSEIGSNVLAGHNTVWPASYLEDPYFFFGDKAFYYDTSDAAWIDLDAENRQWFIDRGGDPANYVPIIGISPIIHNNAMWYAGVGEWRNTVIMAQNFTRLFYDIYTGGLPALTFQSVGGDDSASSSTFDSITNLQEWGPDAIVLKNNSIHRIAGFKYSQLQTVCISQDVGCSVPTSVKRTKAGIIFVHNLNSGIWKYDGQLTNISRPRIDSVLAEMQQQSLVRAGVFRNRYYMLSIGKKTLVYDMDLDTWSVEDQGYGAFEYLGGNTDISIAADNIYSSTTVMVNDPERPGEPQEVLQETPTEGLIVEIGKASARRLEEDGTGGEAIAFEVSTPFLDMGSKAFEKSFCEAMVHFKSAEPVLELDCHVDKVKYVGMMESIDPRPRFDLAFFGHDTYDSIPLYEVKFSLPLDAMGFAASLTLKSSSIRKFRIEDILIYFIPRGSNKEEKEP